MAEDWKSNPVTGVVAAVLVIAAGAFLCWYNFMRGKREPILAEPDVTYMCRECKQAFIVKSEEAEEDGTDEELSEEGDEGEDAKNKPLVITKKKLGSAQRDVRSRRCYACPSCEKQRCVYRATVCDKCGHIYIKPSTFYPVPKKKRKPIECVVCREKNRQKFIYK